MSNYVPTIGLEVHANVKTQTKMFCSCAVTKGHPPNTHTCPVCLAHPGALPVVRKPTKWMTNLEYVRRLARIEAIRSGWGSMALPHTTSPDRA